MSTSCIPAVPIFMGLLWIQIIGQGLVLAKELPPVPEPLGIPRPGPTNSSPYAPQPILPGGIVIPLYPQGSPMLNPHRVHEAEKYMLNSAVPGRINSIVNIHNPSIEVHLVDPSLNKGTVVILAAGGGHNSLNVGTEAADFVPYFYNFGINTVILRNRLRKDGYVAEVDAVNDALQAIRMVRAHAVQWHLDPARIGIAGFSAGAELSAPAALLYPEFDRIHSAASDPYRGIPSRPDFVIIVYPGPTPFARQPRPVIPRDVPPAFVTSPGPGDRSHAWWALQYYGAMIEDGVPNVELHLYGNGFHPGSGSTGGLTDRNGTPFGRWQDRLIDWLRDLGFLQPPGIETKAAKDSAAFQKQDPLKPIGPPRNSTNLPLGSALGSPASGNPGPSTGK
jgi:acetyl esterase/lipase